jgi:hypothetical protein
MNKIYGLIYIFVLLFFQVSLAADVDVWKEARIIATCVGNGQLPSKVIEKTVHQYHVILNNDKQKIILLQEKGGGCVAIFPSVCKTPFFQWKGITMSTPVGISHQDKLPVSWNSAYIMNELDLNSDSIPKKIVIKLLRAVSGVSDTLILNPEDEGIKSSQWKFEAIQ